MLTHYANKYKVVIPYSNYRYQIDINGIITDLLENKEISDSAGKVEISLFGKKKEYSLAWLMIISFKTMYKAESFVETWNVLFVDGNTDNIYPGNLIWSPPINGQECPEIEDFYVIPGYSKYAINKNGDRYNRQFNRVIKLKQIFDNSNSIYYSVSVENDSGKRTSIGLHRALGLAFLPYTKDVWKMIVNHKDGIKLNFNIKNLEWATYLENNLHALDTGLRNARRPVLLKDHYDNSITDFISLSHVSEYLDISNGWVYQMMVEYPNKPINFRYSCQFTDNLKEWPIFNKDYLDGLKKASEKRKFELECSAVNVFTNDKYIASGPGELGQLIGMTKDQVNTGLDTPYPWPSNNFIFSYLNNPRLIRIFKDDELAAFNNRLGIRNPVRVTKSDGSTKVYVSPSELSISLGLPVREIADKLYSSKLYGKSDKYYVDDFSVEYIKY